MRSDLEAAVAEKQSGASVTASANSPHHEGIYYSMDITAASEPFNNIGNGKR
jgi:hypothetical protein